MKRCCLSFVVSDDKRALKKLLSDYDASESESEGIVYSLS